MPGRLVDVGAAWIAAEWGAARPTDIITVKFADVAFVIPLDAAAVADKGGGKVGLPALDHGIPVGASVTIFGTTNYDGVYTAEAETTADELVITAVYSAEMLDGSETATVNPNTPPRPRAVLTDMEGAAVHTRPVDGQGYVTPDNVAFSTYLDTTIGDFDFNQVGYFADDGLGGLVLIMLHNLPPYTKRANSASQTGNNYKHTSFLQLTDAAAKTDITVPAATWQFDLTVKFMRRPPWSVVVGSAAEKALGTADVTLADIEAAPAATIPAGSRVLFKGGVHALAASLTLANDDLQIEGESPEAILAMSTFNLVLSGSRTQARLRLTRTTGTVTLSGAGSILLAMDFPTAAVSSSNGAVAICGGYAKLRGLEEAVVGEGLTFDGVGIKDGAVNPDLGGDFKNGTDSLAGYPFGYSLFSVGSATGWPASAGLVVTVNRGTGDGRSLQIFVDPGANYHFRTWVTSAWATFKTLAPVASPGFTGTPTAPTAAPGTNTTQISTTAFVAAAIAALVDSSPATLDTLNELAVALADDPNFAATMTAALAGKQAISEKGAAGGYASLDGSAKVPDSEIPAAIHGVTLASSAVNPDLGGDFKNGTDSLAGYPFGFSLFSVGSATGWPASAGMVVTVNRGTSDGRSVQYFVNSAGSLSYRSWVTSAWTAFKAFETTNRRNVVGGYLGIEADGSVIADGVTIKDGGIFPGIAGKAATDAGTTYPAGLSVFTVGGSSGWPGAGMVISFNVLASGGNFLQLWVGDASGDHQQRCWTGSAWGAWTTPEKKSNKGAASGYASLNASSQLVEALQDNAVTQAKIAAAAVGQGELKTTVGNVSTLSTQADMILPGGEYGFYPSLKMSSTTFQEWMAGILTSVTVTGGSGSSRTGWTAFTTYITLGEGGANTMYAQQRFIQASPPYDLGNGHIPLFVFAVVLPSSVIESLYGSPDPPWANNGPTSIRPEFFKDKRSATQQKKGAPSPTDLIPMKRVLKRPPRPAPDAPASQIAVWLEAIKNPVWEEIEITQTVKQADMALIPHPFIGNDLTGKTVVLLDPAGAMMEALLGLHEAGESVNELLHEGYLKLDNTSLDCITPPGVTACPVKWKNAK